MRSLNSLKNSNIRTLRDLVEFTEDELLKVKNVGEKALAEIAELLQREGLNFGMQFEEVDGELRVVSAGTPPTRPPAADGRGGLDAAPRQGTPALPHLRATARRCCGTWRPACSRTSRIVTTEAKAKELRPYAEQLITLARRGDLHARRLAERKIATASRSAGCSPRSARASPRRPGGYTRILKLGHRPGDGADMARIELLPE